MTLRLVPTLFGACLAAAQAQAAPTELARLLECTDPAALQQDWDALATRLTADATCAAHRFAGGRELECRPHAAVSAYGLPVGEFSLREGAAGQRELRGVFKAAMSRLRSNAEATHGAAFQSQDDGGALLALGGGRRLRLDQREDGASELACAVPGTREADARRAGADAAHGAIAGRLAFPTSPLPPMRVCAVPADLGSSAGGWCALTAEGEWSFLIGSIPPGEYVVLAWPQRDNPNHYVLGHAAPLQDCVPNEPLCAGGALTRVYLHAGEVLHGIDATLVFTDLPARFAAVPQAR